MLLVLFDRNHDLRADCVPVLHERQKSVRCGARDDLQLAQVLKFSECRDQVATVLFLEHHPGVEKQVPIHVCERVELRLVTGTLDLVLSEFNEFADMTQVSMLQEGVGEHGDKRGCQAHGDAKVDAIVHQRVENIDERNICLGDSLIQPVLFKELVMLRVSYIR